MAVRSLGRLTLDLIANVGSFEKGMTKAQRTAEKRLKAIRKEAARAGKAVAAMGAAATAAATAIVVSTVKSAEEIQRLSNVANTSTREFQRYAAGARTFGIENEKLADIFKDVSDRVGDFLQTGGGPLADFFENIGPKVGVTAEQFRNLSGPQALGLYVSSLEKANANQNEMTFFMEAIAGDATLLLPLLRNNAEGFRIMGDAAENAGNILDEHAIGKANELRAATFLLEQNLSGLKTQIGSALVPVIADLADDFSDAAVDGKNFATVGQFIVESMRDVAIFSVKAAREVTTFGNAAKRLQTHANLAGVETGIDLFGGFSQAFGSGEYLRNQIERREALKQDLQDMESAEAAFNEVIKSLEEAGTGQASERLRKLAKIWEDLLSPRGTGTGINKSLEEQLADADKEAKKLHETIQGQVDALVFQAETLGKTTDQVKLLELQRQKATDTQLASAALALDEIAAFERKNELQEDYKALVDSLRTDQEVLTDQLQDQLGILDQMRISEERRAELTGRIADNLFTEEAPDFAGIDAAIGGPLGEALRLNDAESELSDWYSDQLDMLATFREKRADMNEQWDQQEIELREKYLDELADIEEARGLLQITATQDLFSSLTGIAENFAGKQSGIYKALFLTEKAVAIARSAVAIQTGIAQASALPFPANLAAMANVAAATASILSNIQSINIGSAGGAPSISAGGAGGGSRGNDTAAGVSITGAGIAIADQQGRIGAIRIINLYDPSGIGDYLNSPEGEQVYISTARKNAGAMQEAIVQG